MNQVLIVHGTPAGNKIWGATGGERQYIENFYNGKFDIPSQLIVDVMDFGGQKYCYYTFICTQSFQEKQGRTGGYFALTLRMDVCYCDVQNMYYILEKGFEKFVVDTILKKNGNGYRYEVSDFQQQEGVLRDLSKEISHYIDMFSKDMDLSILTKFSTTKQRTNVFLLECESTKFVDSLSKGVGVCVSRYFNTFRERQIVEKCNKDIDHVNETMKNLQDDCKRQKDETNKKAEDRIRLINDEKIKAISDEKERCKKTIADIEEKHKDDGETIKSLRSEIKRKEDIIKSNNTKINTLESQLDKAQSSKREYDIRLQTVDEILSKLKRCSDDIVPKMQNVMKSMPKNPASKHEVKDEPEGNSNIGEGSGSDKVKENAKHNTSCGENQEKSSKSKFFLFRLIECFVKKDNSL